MIILQKLKWDNCFSYGTGNEIDLSSDTLTQLVGTNGVGKSSIPLILEEVLFNKDEELDHPLSSKETPIRKDAFNKTDDDLDKIHSLLLDGI